MLKQVAFVCAADIADLVNKPNGTDISISLTPYPEYGMNMALYAKINEEGRDERIKILAQKVVEASLSTVGYHTDAAAKKALAVVEKILIDSNGGDWS